MKSRGKTDGDLVPPSSCNQMELLSFLINLIILINQGNAFLAPRRNDTCCGKRLRVYATITLFMLILRAFFRLDRVLQQSKTMDLKQGHE